ncbi:MAG: hypothetical protein WBM24_04560 [Candidatus Sulfotelmatobacter sp.]
MEGPSRIQAWAVKPEWLAFRPESIEHPRRENDRLAALIQCAPRLADRAPEVREQYVREQ